MKKSIFIGVIPLLAGLLLGGLGNDARSKAGFSGQENPLGKQITSVIPEIEMIHVPGGNFWMGSQSSEANEDEFTVNEVSLSSFLIGKTEVTQGQWRAVMGTTPSRYKGFNNPVEQVSWDDVQIFIEKLNQITGKNYRLPTEAEWEYAARGGKYGPGNDRYGDIDKIAWYAGNSKKTQPVGRKQPNSYGLYDMLGNVWEWCQDWYGDFTPEAKTNPAGPATGSYRVYRGGSWDLYDHSIRAPNRENGAPMARYSRLGFRLAMDEGKDARIEAGLMAKENPWKNQIESLISATEMVQIPGGSFLMGASHEDADSRELPQHGVTLKTFFIGKYEVTQELWKTVMRDNPSFIRKDGNYPVENVSWEYCQVFIRKLNLLTGKSYRLPTEAEWEYAARGGKYGPGNDLYGILDDIAWYNDESAGISLNSHPVGQKQPNAYGLYDMLGNVEEWCQDWYGDYTPEAKTNPAGPAKGSSRVVRGGCFAFPAKWIGTTLRRMYPPEERFLYLGFRLAMDG